MKPKVLFVYDHKYESLWRDGLWAALEQLGDTFEIEKWNLQPDKHKQIDRVDFVLGWGAFNSPVDKLLQTLPRKKGLCVAGNTFLPTGMEKYDVIFYETEWAKQWLLETSGQLEVPMFHAFGVNTNIFNSWPEAPIIWDWLSVGAFAYWKRHENIIVKPGNKLVIGEIQKDNWQESFAIISDLLLAGVGISDMLYATKLRNIYNCSANVLISANLMGGGERSVLEARACGRPVFIEDDNPKLKELLDGPIYDFRYYANQLKEGIESVI